MCTACERTIQYNWYVYFVLPEKAPLQGDEEEIQCFVNVFL